MSDCFRIEYLIMAVASLWTPAIWFWLCRHDIHKKFKGVMNMAKKEKLNKTDKALRSLEKAGYLVVTEWPPELSNDRTGCHASGEFARFIVDNYKEFLGK